MDDNIFLIVDQIIQVYQEAYLMLVEDVYSKEVSEDELSYLLDYLLDFACECE